MQSVADASMWLIFVVFVLLMLALDLGVFHGRARVVSSREALGWSAAWLLLAVLFGSWITYKFGRTAGIEFFTGYLVEKSLSVDNVFVFVVIFTALRVPSASQHRVLFWGIASALVLRAGMILGGAALIERFHWAMYLFGAMLVLTGIKLYLARERQLSREEGWLLRHARRLIPNTAAFHGERFFVRLHGRWLATPLFMALVMVEFTDVIFAVDSIPAIFAITRDPFIVFTSNIFAILGLRSLYFVLADAVRRFSYLNVGLAAVLVFIGSKMLLTDLFKVPALASLAVIFGVLGTAVLVSVLRTSPPGGTVRSDA